MEQSVFGILYDSGESTTEGDHTHDLYLIRWDGRPLHVHDVAGITSFNIGHRHRYAGITAPAPSGVQHTHAYYTVTSLDQGHVHVIRGRTGPAISLPGGGHYHLFAGVTTVNGRIPHVHVYRGRTGNARL